MMILMVSKVFEADVSYFESFAVALVKDITNGARSKKANPRKFSDGPFSFPRQPRSVRQRVYMSVDSTSE